MSTRPAFPLRLAWHERLAEAGGEAELPAGSRLADEERPTRHCFLLIEGSAVAEAIGVRVADLASGAFIGSADQSGRPAPVGGLTVRLVTPARVLVLDADRLAALIDGDAEVAGIWRLALTGDPDQQAGAPT
ncbi:MAG TPA: hypothetical protein VFQ44_17110 [Streptosporangiaceae bacterium]|nr:hypothetical protein [Streptosporangiaceae bacterium]